MVGFYRFFLSCARKKFAVRKSIGVEILGNEGPYREGFDPVYRKSVFFQKSQRPGIKCPECHDFG